MPEILAEGGPDFPWTALGYTYDWNAKSTPVGPSEFVARGQTQVLFEQLVPTEELCQAGAPAQATKSSSGKKK